MAPHSRLQGRSSSHLPASSLVDLACRGRCCRCSSLLAEGCSSPLPPCTLLAVACFHPPRSCCCSTPTPGRRAHLPAHPRPQVVLATGHSSQATLSRVLTTVVAVSRERVSFRLVPMSCSTVVANATKK